MTLSPPLISRRLAVLVIPTSFLNLHPIGQLDFEALSITSHLPELAAGGTLFWVGNDSQSDIMRRHIGAVHDRDVYGFCSDGGNGGADRDGRRKRHMFLHRIL